MLSHFKSYASASYICFKCTPECRKLLAFKVGIHNRADDLFYYTRIFLCIFFIWFHIMFVFYFYPAIASMPPVISETSLVMAACRALLNWRVNLSVSSPALSDADFIDTMRALCSDAWDSKSA